MKKTILSASVAALLAVSAISAMAEDAPASPLSFNVGVTSDYVFRGISQTHHDPALQGGIDYAFSNGFYVGTWASTINWVKDGYGKGDFELDIYGGYKGVFADPDWTYDVGFITYNYPGHGKGLPNINTGNNPNSQEAYGSIGWKWLSAKYSYATSSHFIGWNAGANYDQKTRGSDYLELNANYDLGDGWTAIGHVGTQNIKGYVGGTNKSANYTDWKLGVSKDVGFGVVTAAYSATDASGSCNSSTGGTSAYCWATGTFVAGSGSTTNFKDVAKGVVAVSFTKAF